MTLTSDFFGATFGMASTSSFTLGLRVMVAGLLLGIGGLALSVYFDEKGFLLLFAVGWIVCAAGWVMHAFKVLRFKKRK